MYKAYVRYYHWGKLGKGYMGIPLFLQLLVSLKSFQNKKYF